MKKIIAIMMALVMMMAIAVPAFAEDPKLDATTQSGETTVLVDGTNGGAYDGTYTVTIPATINLAWGDTSASDDYVINSQLATEKRVQVVLEKTADLKNDAGEIIAFTATDATDGISDMAVVVDEAHTFNLAIEEDAWKTVSLAAYSGTITFTAGLVNA